MLNTTKFGKHSRTNTSTEETVKLLQDKLDRTAVEKVRLVDDLQGCRASLKLAEESLLTAQGQAEVLCAQVKSLETKLTIETQSKEDLSRAMQDAQRKFLEAAEEASAANSKRA